MARAARVIAAAPGSYVEWSAVIAGAVGASAISFLLLTFGGAIGLTLTSPLPGSSGLGAWGMLTAVAWWAIMVQIGSFFTGGYLAGRMRARWSNAMTDESRFRDGTHGFLVWAVGVLAGAVLLAIAGGATFVGAAKTVSSAAGVAASPSGADYATDLLLRPAPTAPGTAITSGQGQSYGQREAVKRVFGMTIRNRELTGSDRDYLTDTVSARTGLSRDDAQKRVDATIAATQKFEQQARASADKARRYGLITGFLAAASLLISLAAAVAGAHLGGLHRNEGTVAHLFGRRFW